MKSQIATTKEQSLRLLRCGVSADTADMCLSTRTRRYDGTFIAKKHQTTNLWIGYPCSRTTSGDEELENIPAWSLGALLGLLPKEICDENGDSYHFSLAQEYPSNADYRAAYKYYSVDECDYVGRRSSQPIEACVQLIEWLTENNYKLNEL